MTPGITVIIPTIGRETLADTLESVVYQLSKEDRVIVAFDGIQEPSSLAQEYRTRVFWLYVETKQGGFGHPLRNHILNRHVNTTHVWTIDDDDVATPTAFSAMRKHFEDPWTIFRMHFGSGHYANGLTLPNSFHIRHGNIGTPMVFAPLTEARYGHHYSGDFDYVYELNKTLGEPVWAHDVVAIIRP